MTNENLAILAQDPENKELVPVLWDKVKDMLYMKSNRTYRLYSGLFARCGIEVSDIMQSCYSVFLEALKGYKPDSGIKFITYLNYPFKTMMQELTHARTSRKEPMNDAISLDIPLQDKDGETDNTPLSLLPDKTVNVENDVLDSLEQYEERQSVRDAVAALPELQRNVIEAIYFRNEMQKDIAKRMGCTPARVQQIKTQAFQMLRRSPFLRQIYMEWIAHIRWRNVQRLEERPEYFEVVQELRERQEQGERISYGKFKAELYSYHLKAIQTADKQPYEQWI